MILISHLVKMLSCSKFIFLIFASITYASSINHLSSRARLTTATSLTQATPLPFYSNLVKSISTAKGHIFLEFRTGRFLVNTGGYITTWVIGPETTADLDFDYSNSSWNKLEVKFNKPIIIRPVDNKPSAQISIISYDQRGRIRSSFPNRINEAGIRRQLEFKRNNITGLFFGEPFAAPSQVTTKPANGEPVPVTTIFQRVTFDPNQGNNVGLEVTLTNNTLLDFGVGNSARVAAGNFTRFTTLDYEIDSKNLNGVLAGFKMPLHDGRFSTDNFKLNLTEGSRLEFENLEFSFINGIANVDGAVGKLEGVVGEDSKLTFSMSNENSSEFVFGTNCSVRLAAFTLKSDTKDNTAISVGGDSEISFNNIIDGVLAFGEKGFLRFNDGAFKASIQEGKWVKGSRPIVKGRLDLVNVRRILSAKLSLNEKGLIDIDSGSLSSRSLTFNTENIPVVTGPWDHVDLSPSSETFITLPQSVSFRASSGGRIRAVNPNEKFRFEPNNPYPLGELDFDLNYSVLNNQNNLPFELRNGHARILMISESGQVANISLLHITGSLQEMRVKFGDRGFMNLTGGTLETRLAGRTSPAFTDMTGSLALPHSTVTGGKLPITDNSEIGIKGGGTFQADSLKIATKNGLAVTGPIKLLSLMLEPNSTINFAGSWRMVTRDSGVFVADNTNLPLTLTGDARQFTGQYRITTPFRYLTNAAEGQSGNFALEDGRATLPLTHLPNGTITGSTISIDGMMHVPTNNQVPINNIPSGGTAIVQDELDINIALRNGELRYSPLPNGQKVTTLTATMSGQLPEIEIRHRTETSSGRHRIATVVGQDVERDVAIHSVMIHVKIPASDFSSGIIFSNNNTSFTIKTQPKIMITIPADKPEKDADDFERLQLIARITCSPGYYDFAFKDRSYSNIPSSLDLTPSDGTFSGAFSISSLPRPELKWDKCVPLAAISALGAGVGQMMCGPACAAVGGIGVNELMDKFVEKKVEEKLSERLGAFTMKFPQEQEP